MSQDQRELIKEIRGRVKAADLIESSQLLHRYNSFKADYLAKQPLLQQKKDYLDRAHLLPEMPWYGHNSSRQDGANPYRSGKDIGTLMRNEYVSPTTIKSGIYLPMNYEVIVKCTNNGTY